MSQELYVGLMSGTSMDGIDAVLAAFDRGKVRVLHAVHSPWPIELLHDMQRVSADPESATLPLVAALDVRTGQEFAAAALRVIRESGTDPATVVAIGSHGQTILHRPQDRSAFTVQIGDPGTIAVLTGRPVVADFRRGDMALGGQGAPLVPAFHRDFFGRPGEAGAVVNIGGIANVSALTSADTVVAYDTGPGNCLLDQWIRRHKDLPFDRHGAWAASGRPDPELSRELLADAWFELPPPKSTGVDKFNIGWVEAALERLGRRPAPVDVQATLAELTAATVASALQRHEPTKTVVIAGGGALNADLMERLSRLLPDRSVSSSLDWGLHPTRVEAVAFAWLARERVHGRPGNLPSATGARAGLPLGGLYLPPV